MIVSLVVRLPVMCSVVNYKFRYSLFNNSHVLHFVWYLSSLETCKLNSCDNFNFRINRSLLLLHTEMHVCTFAKHSFEHVSVELSVSAFKL